MITAPSCINRDHKAVTAYEKISSSMWYNEIHMLWQNEFSIEGESWVKVVPVFCLLYSYFFSISYMYMSYFLSLAKTVIWHMMKYTVVISYSYPVCTGLINTLRWDKMADFFQTTFSNAFSWMKMCEFRLKIHWSLFLKVLLTIFQHWFW